MHNNIIIQNILFMIKAILIRISTILRIRMITIFIIITLNKDDNHDNNNIQKQ